MDPNETLKQIRALIADWHTEQWKLSSDVILEITEDILEQFQALDTWLQGGGFLPADWTPPSP